MISSPHRIHEGKLSHSGYQARARILNVELGDIVTNCKLEPRADAQLHLIVADLAEGLEAMEGRTGKPNPPEIRRTLVCHLAACAESVEGLVERVSLPG